MAAIRPGGSGDSTPPGASSQSDHVVRWEQGSNSGALRQAARDGGQPIEWSYTLEYESEDIGDDR